MRGGISITLALSLPAGPTRDLLLAATFAGGSLESPLLVGSGRYPSQCKTRAVSGLDGSQSNLAVSAKHMIISSGLTTLVPKRMVL